MVGYQNNLINNFMKYKDLFEKTFDNTIILKDLSDIVYDLMPDIILPYTTIIKNKYHISRNFKFKEIYNKYRNTQYEKILNQFKNLTIIYDNSKNNNTRGTYSGTYNRPQVLQKEEITIFIGSINKKIDYIKKDVLLNKNTDIFNLKSVIIHELRHFLQYHLFDKNYMKNQYSNIDKYNNHFNYDNNNIEIDASFYHILSLHEPHKYDIKEFAKKILHDLSNYKNLNHKQKTNYLKKAIQYYIDISNTDEFKNKKNEKENKQLKNKIIDFISYNNDSIYLNKFKNYNSNRFIIPSHLIKSTIYNFINNIEFFINSFHSIIIFILLYFSDNSKEQKLKIFNQLEKLNINLNNSLSYIDEFDKAGFDGNSIKENLISFFIINK